MPDTELLSAPLSPNGDRLVSPPLGDPAEFAYRVIVEGVFTFTYNGEQFDALYRGGPDGPFTRTHALLDWGAGTPRLVEQDRGAHRYTFSVPRGAQANGRSVGLRINVDRLVDEFLIPPSEVRKALSGSLQVTVLRAPLAPAPIWPIFAWASVPTAAVLAGAALVIRRRMALAGLDPDLQESLARIERKCRDARTAARKQPSGLSVVGERVDGPRVGATGLIRMMQRLRTAQARADRVALESGVATLDRHLATMKDAGDIRDAETAMAQKRRTLEALNEVDRAAARCAMRFAAIEATLDTACLALRSTGPGDLSSVTAESLCRDLDAGVDAIREVAEFEQLLSQR